MPTSDQWLEEIKQVTQGYSDFVSSPGRNDMKEALNVCVRGFADITELSNRLVADRDTTSSERLELYLRTIELRLGLLASIVGNIAVLLDS